MILSSKNLKKLATKAQSKKSRKMVLREYKAIKKILFKRAKKGFNRYDYTGHFYGHGSWELLIAFRLIRFKNRELDMHITYINNNDEFVSFQDSDKYMVKVNF